MPKVHVRGGKLTVAIPEDIREEIAAYDGDEIDLSTEAGRIVLTPKEATGRDLATEDAIAEGLADLRAGRVSPPFETAEEIEEWQKTAEYKKFIRKA